MAKTIVIEVADPISKYLEPFAEEHKELWLPLKENRFLRQLSIPEVKAGHWLLWNYIAKSETPWKKPYISSYRLKATCFPCTFAFYEYEKAYQKEDKCKFCPLECFNEHRACYNVDDDEKSNYYNYWCRTSNRIFEENYKSNKTIKLKVRKLAFGIRDYRFKSPEFDLDEPFWITLTKVE